MPSPPVTRRMPAIVERADARSLENPSTPLSAPDDWLFDALGGYRASSGVSINRETALTYAPWWRGINLISSDVGKLPAYVMKRTTGGRFKDPKHPAYKLLRRKPNGETKAFTFKKTLTAHALTTGNGYAFIVRDNAMRPLSMFQLGPDRTFPVRVNGELWYITQLQSGERRKLPARDVFHLPGFAWDGLQGYNVIHKARESLGLGIAQQSYGSIFFRNNARPNIILEFPGQLEPKTRREIAESWERMHAGLENSHRTAVLDRGLKANILNVNARDAQLIESRQLSVRDVANWLGVPPHKLGDTTKANYNSLEQENQSYLDECLDPWLVTWEEECWDKLLTEQQKDAETHFVHFDRRELERADLSARTGYYVQGLTNGWLNIDEVREREGENAAPDGIGQQFRAPLNTAVLQPPVEAGDNDETPAGQAAGDPGADLLDVPDVRQTDNYSCGAACAMAVGRYFGVGPETIEEWKLALGTSPADSTRPMRIVEYLTELGLLVTAGGDLDLDDLQQFWRQGAPVICPIQEYGVPGKQASFDYGHYVIVVGLVGEKDRYVIVQDPSIDNVLEGQDADQAPGRMLIREEDWLAGWHDQDADGKPYLRFGIAAAKELPEPPPSPEAPADGDPEAPPAPGKKPGRLCGPLERRQIVDAHRQLLTDIARRMCKRLGLHARKAAKHPETFAAWLDSFAAEHRGIIIEALSPALAVANVLAHGEHTIDVVVDGLLSAARDQFARALGYEAIEARINDLAAALEELQPQILTDSLLPVAASEPLVATKSR